MLWMCARSLSPVAGATHQSRISAATGLHQKARRRRRSSHTVESKNVYQITSTNSCVTCVY